MYKIAVVTGTRAEYGLLRPVLLKMAGDAEIELILLVTGAHLAAEYGFTVQEIEADEKCGIHIDAEIDILSAAVPGTREGTALRTADMLGRSAAYFAHKKPDAVLVLGDRYEIFAAAQAAALLDIPVVHISGGDVTRGADDDWFRHCITKMAKLHFPSCEAYRQRVIRMGEPPETVFNVGGLGDENIRKMQLLSQEELAQGLELPLQQPYALVTFHPETVSSLSPESQVKALLQAVESNPQLFYLFTKANADAGGVEMNHLVQAYCERNKTAVLVSSLGVLRYLSAMKYAALVLGNSSSGVVETPSFGTPCVNIGGRQDGRLRSENILYCPTEAPAISRAIQTAASAAFFAKAHAVHSPYNGGDTSGKILSILKAFLHDKKLKEPKMFYDGEAELCGY